MFAIRILLPLVFTLHCAVVRAGISPLPNYTPEETRAHIKRLTAGTDQRITKTYKDGILFSEEWDQEWPLRYIRYYYPDGKLKSAGLMSSYNNVGTWTYYGWSGSKVKTADYNTMSQTFENRYNEPYLKIRLMMAARADSFVLAHFGQAFLDSFHVQCEQRFYSTATDQTCQWMDIPEGKPETFSFYYVITIEDSIQMDLISFEINKEGKFRGGYKDLASCTDSLNRCAINVSYREAMHIAAEQHFPDSTPYLSWGETGYAWHFSGPATGTRNDQTFLAFSIDAGTGRIDSAHLVRAMCDHCEPVVFKKSYPDSMQVPEGYKRRNYSGVFMNIPSYWIELEEYGKTSAYSSVTYWFGNGDTVRIHETSGHTVKDLDFEVYEMQPRYPAYNVLLIPRRPEHIVEYHTHDKVELSEATRRSWRREDSLYRVDSAYVAHYNDSAQKAYYHFIDSMDNVKRQRAAYKAWQQHVSDSVMQIFHAAFPNDSTQGRPVSVSFSASQNHGADWSISMEINDPHGGYGVGQSNYYFHAGHLTEEQFWKILDVFCTARFLTYR